jgi:PBP1b-binding outer membrane lipoprotein LpoB
MKILSALALTATLLSGCISSGSPNPPQKTTVVVPAGSTTTVICQDGSRPPC